MKKIFIINGMAGSGKDTFVSFLNEIIPTKHISIVDKVKETAKALGWNGEKTEKDRKFLSDLKIATDEYDNRNYEYVKEQVKNFLENNDEKYEVLCIDMREKKQILQAVKDFGATSVLVYRNNVKNILSNPADANVFNMDYDVVIKNNGTLEELKETAKEFANTYIVEKKFKTKQEAYEQGLKDGRERNFVDVLMDIFGF